MLLPEVQGGYMEIDDKWDWLLAVITGFGVSFVGIFCILMLYVLGVVW